MIVNPFCAIQARAEKLEEARRALETELTSAKSRVSQLEGLVKVGQGILPRVRCLTCSLTHPVLLAPACTHARHLHHASSLQTRDKEVERLQRAVESTKTELEGMGLASGRTQVYICRMQPVSLHICACLTGLVQSLCI